MATLVVETLVDDIDGSEAAETISFVLGKDTFEIDLSEENPAGLRDKLAKFIEVAQPVKTPKVKKITKQVIGMPSTKEQTHALRSWASQNGFTVSKR